MSGGPIGDYLNEKKRLASDNALVRKHSRLLARGILKTTKIHRHSIIKLTDDLGSHHPFQDLTVGVISRKISIQPEKTLKEADATAPAELFKCSNSKIHNYYKLCVPASMAAIRQAHEELVLSVIELCESGAKLICASELAYPSFTTPPDDSWTVSEFSDDAYCYHAIPSFEETELTELKVLNDKLTTKLRELSKTHDAIILAGTHHNCETYCNEAMLFVPNPTEGITNPYIHRKISAAKSKNVAEIIRTPDTDVFPLYSTAIGKIAVLVCIDVYDLNMLFRQFHASREMIDGQRADIILVPSYSEKSLHDACKDLSEMANCTVIYVNAKNTTSDRFPDYCVYVSGELAEQRSKIGENTSLHTLVGRDRESRYRDKEYELASGIFGQIYNTLPVIRAT